MSKQVIKRINPVHLFSDAYFSPFQNMLTDFFIHDHPLPAFLLERQGDHAPSADAYDAFHAKLAHACENLPQMEGAHNNLTRFLYGIFLGNLLAQFPDEYLDEKRNLVQHLIERAGLPFPPDDITHAHCNARFFQSLFHFYKVTYKFPFASSGDLTGMIATDLTFSFKALFLFHSEIPADLKQQRMLGVIQTVKHQFYRCYFSLLLLNEEGPFTRWCNMNATFAFLEALSYEQYNGEFLAANPCDRSAFGPFQDIIHAFFGSMHYLNLAGLDACLEAIRAFDTDLEALFPGHEEAVLLFWRTHQFGLEISDLINRIETPEKRQSLLNIVAASFYVQYPRIPIPEDLRDDDHVLSIGAVRALVPKPAGPKLEMLDASAIIQGLLATRVFSPEEKGLIEFFLTGFSSTKIRLSLFVFDHSAFDTLIHMVRLMVLLRQGNDIGEVQLIQPTQLGDLRRLGELIIMHNDVLYASEFDHHVFWTQLSTHDDKNSFIKRYEYLLGQLADYRFQGHSTETMCAFSQTMFRVLGGIEPIQGVQPNLEEAMLVPSRRYFLSVFAREMNAFKPGSPEHACVESILYHEVIPDVELLDSATIHAGFKDVAQYYYQKSQTDTAMTASILTVLFIRQLHWKLCEEPRFDPSLNATVQGLSKNIALKIIQSELFGKIVSGELREAFPDFSALFNENDKVSQFYQLLSDFYQLAAAYPTRHLLTNGMLINDLFGLTALWLVRQLNASDAFKAQAIASIIQAPENGALLGVNAWHPCVSVLLKQEQLHLNGYSLTSLMAVLPSIFFALGVPSEGESDAFKRIRFFLTEYSEFDDVLFNEAIARFDRFSEFVLSVSGRFDFGVMEKPAVVSSIVSLFGRFSLVDQERIDEDDALKSSALSLCLLLYSFSAGKLDSFGDTFELTDLLESIDMERFVDQHQSRSPNIIVNTKAIMGDCVRAMTLDAPVTQACLDFLHLFNSLSVFDLLALFDRPVFDFWLALIKAKKQLEMLEGVFLKTTINQDETLADIVVPKQLQRFCPQYLLDLHAVVTAHRRVLNKVNTRLRKKGTFINIKAWKENNPVSFLGDSQYVRQYRELFAGGIDAERALLKSVSSSSVASPKSKRSPKHNPNPKRRPKPKLSPKKKKSKPTVDWAAVLNAKTLPELQKVEAFIKSQPKSHNFIRFIHEAKKQRMEADALKILLALCCWDAALVQEDEALAEQACAALKGLLDAPFEEAALRTLFHKKKKTTVSFLEVLKVFVGDDRTKNTEYPDALETLLAQLMPKKKRKKKKDRSAGEFAAHAERVQDDAAAATTITESSVSEPVVITATATAAGDDAAIAEDKIVIVTEAAHAAVDLNTVDEAASVVVPGAPPSAPDSVQASQHSGAPHGVFAPPQFVPLVFTPVQQGFIYMGTGYGILSVQVFCTALSDIAYIQNTQTGLYEPQGMMQRNADGTYATLANGSLYILTPQMMAAQTAAAQAVQYTP